MSPLEMVTSGSNYFHLQADAHSEQIIKNVTHFVTEKL